MNDSDHDTKGDCYLIMSPIYSLSLAKTILLLEYMYQYMLCVMAERKLFSEKITIQHREQNTGVSLLPQHTTSHKL